MSGAVCASFRLEVVVDSLKNYYDTHFIFYDLSVFESALDFDGDISSWDVSKVPKLTSGQTTDCKRSSNL